MSSIKAVVIVDDLRIGGKDRKRGSEVQVTEGQLKILVSQKLVKEGGK